MANTVGRPKKEEVRTNRTLRAYDHEWELVRKVAALIKKDDATKAEIEKMVEKLSKS